MKGQVDITRTQADAQKAISDLNAKKSFASVLKQYSIDERAKQAGGIQQGYVPLKDLQEAVPPLYAAVKDLKKGAHTTTPLQDSDVYAVFYVNDRRDVKLPSYDESKSSIAQDLQASRVDEALQSLLQKATIK